MDYGLWTSWLAVRMHRMAFIELENVSRWYGTHQALKDVSLHLQPGRIGLLGPNGAGKSTLLKILLGLLPPSSGTGYVLGHPLEEIAGEEDSSGRVAARAILRVLSVVGRAPLQLLESVVASSKNGRDAAGTGKKDGHGAALRRAIGYMPEADALIPGLKGAEYVALAGELYGMPRRQAERRAHEVLNYLKMEDARYRPLDEYSTGMKQRLKLAQALVHDPPVLLLDEPTSGLDPAGREAMLDLLLTLSREHGKSFILSTHLLGDVEQVCDSVVILNRGQVLLQGNVGALRTRRQNRYRLQIEGEPAAFLEELRHEGVSILEDNGRGELCVVAPEGWITRALF